MSGLLNRKVSIIFPTIDFSASAKRADPRKIQKVFTSGCYNLPSMTPPVGSQYGREGPLHR